MRSNESVALPLSTRRFGVLSGLAGLLAAPMAGLWALAPSYAATGPIAITSTTVQVEKVGQQGTWIPPVDDIVYEGTSARLRMNVDNPGDTTAATVTATLAGRTDAVASVTRTIGPGTQTLEIPLDFSVGAWKSTGVANGDANGVVDLTVALAYDYRDRPGPTPVPAPSSTPTPTTTPSPTPSTTPTITPSITVTPVTRPAPTSPVRLQFGAATRLTPKMANALRQRLAAAPAGAQVTAIVRGAVPAKGATAADWDAADERARAVARALRSQPAMSAPGSSVVVLAPARTKDKSAWSQVTTSITWSTSPAMATTAGVRLTGRAGNLGSEQSTTTLPMKLAPRPTVLLHGLWSNARQAWDEYTKTNGFQQSTHPLWQAKAVTGMNTGALLSPFGVVNTVSENMEVAWTYLSNVRTSLNAQEVDIVAHSMGGIITRRLLHSTHANEARAAIRSVVMLGTPNGGSTCADTWSVKATEPLRPAVMRTFNESNPGYPGVVSSLFYSTPNSLTCLSLSRGDSVVPEWSAKAQPVNNLVKAAGSTCGSGSSTCDIVHTSMTTDAGWFRNYVLPSLALAASPEAPTPAEPEDIPSDDDVVLAKGTAGAGAVSQSVTLTLAANESLSVSIVTDDTTPSFTATPSGGSPMTLVQQGADPVYAATIDGPLSNVTVTLTGTTTNGLGWTFTKVRN